MAKESLYSPLMQKDENQKNNHPVTIAIVVTVLILISGLIFIKAQKNSEVEEANQNNISTSVTEETFSTSTELDSINTDLQELEETINSSNLDQLDQEIKNLE